MLKPPERTEPMRETERCIHRVMVLTFLAFGLLGCTQGSVSPATSSDLHATNTSVPLFAPSTVLQDRWQHIRFRGETEYRLAHQEDRLSIRAIGRKSASGLIRRTAVDPTRCPIIEWEWRVEAMQPGADITSREKEDVAASILLLLGDPGFLSAPEAVPVLRYVWTNRHVPAEAIVDNPYMRGIVRSIVVRSGTSDLKRWVTERRNVLSDYEKAFGKALDQPIHAVAIFTDNDQTGQHVEAHYGAAAMICR